MTLNGKTVFEKACFLVETMKKDGLRVVSEEKLSRYVAIYLGSNKQIDTIGQYKRFMLGIGMIKKDGTKYRINFAKIKP